MAVSFPKVGIVVLNFNGRNCLPSCLSSLRHLRYQNFFVLVVDNASTDGSLAQSKKDFPEFYFVDNRENRGFAAGMNIGMRAAFEKGAKWVWLFNNDARADEMALTSLMAAVFEKKEAGLLSPYIYDERTGELWFGKGRIDSLRMRVVHILPSTEEQRMQQYPSEFLTGCALLISKTVVEAIGYLDERFFLYYEDADFSKRAKGAGFSVLVVPKAEVFHREQSQENKNKLYHLVFSGLLFFRKHATRWQKAYFFVYGTMRRIKNAVDIMYGRRRALSVRRAYHDFYHGR